MFGIGMPELIIVLVVALLVLGPRKLPEVARSLGRGLAEFRRASTEIRNSLTAPIEEPLEPPTSTRPAPKRAEPPSETDPEAAPPDKPGNA